MAVCGMPTELTPPANNKRKEGKYLSIPRVCYVNFCKFTNPLPPPQSPKVSIMNRFERHTLFRRMTIVLQPLNRKPIVIMAAYHRHARDTALHTVMLLDKPESGHKSNFWLLFQQTGVVVAVGELRLGVIPVASERYVPRKFQSHVVRSITKTCNVLVEDRSIFYRMFALLE